MVTIYLVITKTVYYCKLHYYMSVNNNIIHFLEENVVLYIKSSLSQLRGACFWEIKWENPFILGVGESKYQNLYHSSTSSNDWFLHCMFRIHDYTTASYKLEPSQKLGDIFAQGCDLLWYLLYYNYIRNNLAQFETRVSNQSILYCHDLLYNVSKKQIYTGY